MRVETIKSYFENLNYIVYKFMGEDDNLKNLYNITFDVDKKYIIFFHNDYYGNFEFPNNVIIFRASLLKSKKKHNEYIYPVSWVHYNRQLPYLNESVKGLKPKVGFCGSITTHTERKKWLEKLCDSNLLECDFIYKIGFATGSFDELLKNLYNNEFCFCPRGTGNFSLRFYETLCYGRIPVILDTDTILPFENEINWNEIIVIGKDIDELPQKIFDFWKCNDIFDIQKKCKTIYDTYFNSELLLNIYEKQIDNYFLENN
jgi:hypothetical protein